MTNVILPIVMHSAGTTLFRWTPEWEKAASEFEAAARKFTKLGVMGQTEAAGTMTVGLLIFCTVTAASFNRAAVKARTNAQPKAGSQ